MTETTLHNAHTDALPTIIQQEKLDRTLQKYIVVLAGEHPFTKDIKVDARRLVSELSDNWPNIRGWETQKRELMQCIDRLVRSIPTIPVAPDTLIRVSVGPSPRAPAFLPEPEEVTVIATLDATDGTLRRCIITGGTDAAPALSSMAIESGLIVICQHVPTLQNRFGDNRPWSFGNGSNLYSPRARDPIVWRGDQLPEDAKSVTGPPNPGLNPPSQLILSPEFPTTTTPPRAVMMRAGLRFFGKLLVAGVAYEGYEEFKRHEERKHAEKMREENMRKQQAKHTDDITKEAAISSAEAVNGRRRQAYFSIAERQKAPWQLSTREENILAMTAEQMAATQRSITISPENSSSAARRPDLLTTPAQMTNDADVETRLTALEERPVPAAPQATVAQQAAGLAATANPARQQASLLNATQAPQTTLRQGQNQPAINPATARGSLATGSAATANQAPAQQPAASQQNRNMAAANTSGGANNPAAAPPNPQPARHVQTEAVGQPQQRQTQQQTGRPQPQQAARSVEGEAAAPAQTRPPSQAHQQSAQDIRAEPQSSNPAHSSTENVQEAARETTRPEARPETGEPQNRAETAQEVRPEPQQRNETPHRESGAQAESQHSQAQEVAERGAEPEFREESAGQQRTETQQAARSEPRQRSETPQQEARTQEEPQQARVQEAAERGPEPGARQETGPQQTHTETAQEARAEPRPNSERPQTDKVQEAARETTQPESRQEARAQEVADRRVEAEARPETARQEARTESPRAEPDSHQGGREDSNATRTEEAQPRQEAYRADAAADRAPVREAGSDGATRTAEDNNIREARADTVADRRAEANNNSADERQQLAGTDALSDGGHSHAADANAGQTPAPDAHAAHQLFEAASHATEDGGAAGTVHNAAYTTDHAAPGVEHNAHAAAEQTAAPAAHIGHPTFEAAAHGVEDNGIAGASVHNAAYTTHVASGVSAHAGAAQNVAPAAVTQGAHPLAEAVAHGAQDAITGASVHNAAYTTHAAHAAGHVINVAAHDVTLPPGGFAGHTHNGHAPSYEQLDPRSDQFDVAAAGSIAPAADVSMPVPPAGNGLAATILSASGLSPLHAVEKAVLEEAALEVKKKSGGGESDSRQPKTARPAQSDTQEKFLRRKQKAAERMQFAQKEMNEEYEEKERAMEAQENAAPQNHPALPTLDPGA